MIWAGVVLYLAVGAVVALVFALWAAAATDHAARGAGLWFRLAILPGAALLWPYMILRVLSFRRINKPIPDRGA
jgi:hypothetical protein